MAEWLYEESFDEKRALLVENDQVIAAKLYWHSPVCAGTIVQAKIISRQNSSSRGLCQTKDGHEINVPDLPRDAPEGSEVSLTIHREPIAERGRLKRAQGRYLPDPAASHPNSAHPNSAFTHDAHGNHVRHLPAGLWEDVWSLASDGEMAFTGGNLIFSVTPAMTLIDIDGHGSPVELALAAVPAIGQAIRWLDLNGSIGIDFPTIPDKAGRKQVDAALALALDDWAHERTAMNGFGFVQIVARMQMPSLLHRAANSRASTCARFLLRSAAMITEPGVLLLSCHPAVAGAIKEEWLTELRKFSGKEVQIETKPTIALEAGFAQAITG